MLDAGPFQSANGNGAAGLATFAVLFTGVIAYARQNPWKGHGAGQGVQGAFPVFLPDLLNKLSYIDVDRAGTGTSWRLVLNASLFPGCKFVFFHPSLSLGSAVDQI
jgi:hypothetical protein